MQCSGSGGWPEEQDADSVPVVAREDGSCGVHPMGAVPVADGEGGLLVQLAQSARAEAKAKAARRRVCGDALKAAYREHGHPTLLLLQSREAVGDNVG